MNVTQNRDAELAIIGIALQDRPCAVRMAALPEEAFSAADTRAAHKAIRSMIAGGEVPDLITVADRMQADAPNPEGMLVESMGKGFASLYNQYESIVFDCLKRRKAIAAATELLRGANDPGESIDGLIAKSIDTVRNVGGVSSSVSMKDALTELYDEMENGWKYRCRVGIANFDRLTGGVRKSNLAFFGARPGVGKTALALSMAFHVATHSGPVLFVSMEMSAPELAARICAAATKVDLQRISLGELTGEEWALFAPTVGELAKVPLQLDEKSRTPSQIRREAVRMQSTSGLSMIVVDYVQLIESDQQHASRYQELTKITREMKVMAMELDVPIIMLTQFNRESEKTFGSTQDHRKPKMSEAKDSGSIEQDANIFVTQWEPPVPTEQGTREWNDYHCCQMNGWTWQVLEVDKNRQGKTGRFSIGFDKARMTFHCLYREGDAP